MYTYTYVEVSNAWPHTYVKSLLTKHSNYAISSSTAAKHSLIRLQLYLRLQGFGQPNYSCGRSSMIVTAFSLKLRSVLCRISTVQVVSYQLARYRLRYTSKSSLVLQLLQSIPELRLRTHHHFAVRRRLSAAPVAHIRARRPWHYQQSS